MTSAGSRLVFRWWQYPQRDDPPFLDVLDGHEHLQVRTKYLASAFEPSLATATVRHHKPNALTLQTKCVLFSATACRLQPTSTDKLCHASDMRDQSPYFSTDILQAFTANVRLLGLALHHVGLSVVNSQKTLWKQNAKLPKRPTSSQNFVLQPPCSDRLCPRPTPCLAASRRRPGSACRPQGLSSATDTRTIVSRSREPLAVKAKSPLARSV